MTFQIAPTVYADDAIKDWFYGQNKTNFDQVAKQHILNAFDSNTTYYNVFIFRVEEPYIALWFEYKVVGPPYGIYFYDSRIYLYSPPRWDILEMIRDDLLIDAIQTIEQLSIKYNMICIPNWQCEVDLNENNTGYKIDLNNCEPKVHDINMCPLSPEIPIEPIPSEPINHVMPSQELTSVLIIGGTILLLGVVSLVGIHTKNK